MLRRFGYGQEAYSHLENHDEQSQHSNEPEVSVFNRTAPTSTRPTE